MLRFTRCNIVILMAATAWLMLSFSSCVLCGFDSQLQPSKSLCYIGYTSTWRQHDCWLTVQTLYALYILTPERISQEHVQNGKRATFSWLTLYNIYVTLTVELMYQKFESKKIEVNLGIQDFRGGRLYSGRFLKLRMITVSFSTVRHFEKFFSDLEFEEPESTHQRQNLIFKKIHTLKFTFCHRFSCWSLLYS